MSFTQKWPKVVLRHFNVTYLNPFDTLRSCKMRLFERQNRGASIGETPTARFCYKNYVSNVGQQVLHRATHSTRYGL